MLRKLRLLLIILAVGGIGFAAGYFSVSEPNSTDSRQIRSGIGKLTNPLLECEVAQGTIDSKKVSFYSDLKRFVAELEKDPNINKIAVYFRDLNNGPAFGVNEYETFIPASLLKVPIMMSYLKLAETTPDLLSSSILFTEEARRALNMGQQIAPAETLKVGTTYTVRELMEKMIAYSDNQSALLLMQYAPENSLETVYELLNLDSNVINDAAGAISVRQYSSFFRILFNASFLSQNYSEQALDLLTKTAFADGLRAGVPADIAIAHKFGERLIDGSEQIHDCGIVYYPKHPYLLCVMSKGTSLTSLTQSLKKVSEFVYEKVNSQNYQ